MAAALCASTSAEAQEEGAVSATGKGIAGGALLGAELVLITEAIIEVDEWWPYVVFGVAGAGAGAVGGYFVEQVDVAEPSLYMLAGGMALIVPTVVAVLNATAYDPDEDDDGVLPEGESPGEEVTTEGRIPSTLLALGPSGSGWRGVSLGVPAVAVQPAYTPVEVAQFGVQQTTEVHVPLLGGRF